MKNNENEIDLNSDENEIQSQVFEGSNQKPPSKAQIIIVGCILAYFFFSGVLANIYFIFIK